MNARELWEWLGNNTSPDDEITLEVGGDGAIHGGTLKSVRREADGKLTTLSAEEA